MSRMSLQVFGILGFALVVFVGWDFSQRAAATVRSQQMEVTVDQELAHAQATRTALAELKKQVQTDAYVEDWARRRNYVRDGETLVHPLITPAAPLAAVDPPIAVAQQQSDPWQRWSHFVQSLFEFLFGP
ncbi:MAG: hypothetical protein HY782_07730 [Chloroflexi bacterium]|nr:hypothetical protein [Chloroflexota bacterium]